MKTELPIRKKIRLEGYDYSTNGAYFVTICAKDRQKLFGTIVGATVPGRPMTVPYIELSEIGKIVDSAIIHNNRDGVSIPKYVIMPNHIHMIVVLERDAGDRGQDAGDRGQDAGDRGRDAGDRGRSPLRMIVRNMKAYITKKSNFSLWQKSFYDHIIRDDEDYKRIWQYIDENPLKWQEDCYYE